MEIIPPIFLLTTMQCIKDEGGGKGHLTPLSCNILNCLTFLYTSNIVWWTSLVPTPESFHIFLFRKPFVQINVL